MARNLIGTGADQVSVNGMLGELAFQSKENVNFTGGTGKLSKLDIDAISAQLNVSAVDVFVYDTRKDSDGGAWRKRCQNTSWYNETLNTATRGSRQEFPAVAVIVATATSLTIYDGDDATLPMWMVFNRGVDANPTMWWDGNNTNTATGVCALNGLIMLTTTAAGSYGADFIAERYLYFYNSQPNSGYRPHAGGLVNRNLAVTSRIVSVQFNGYSSSSNHTDVAMKVLPNAPIDQDTGLPTPTIAIATTSNVNIIRDNGVVVKLSQATTPYTNFISFAGNKITFFTDGGPEYKWFQIFDIPTSDTSYSFSVLPNNLYSTYFEISTWLPLTPGYISDALNDAMTFDNYVAAADTKGLGIGTLDSTPSGSENKNLVSHITTKYNTGWMPGNIKGAWLSDTSQETVTALITPAVSTWYSVRGGTASVSSNTVTVTSGSVMSWNGASIAVSGLTPGKQYVAKINPSSVTNGSGSWYLWRTLNSDGTHSSLIYSNTVYGTNAQQPLTASTNSWLVWTAVNTTEYLIVQNSVGATGATIVFSDFEVRNADSDRSVNIKSLQVYGNITKTPVAAGADLVAYSGFSGSNYLYQPYSSSLDFGTGSFSVMTWINTAIPGNNGVIFARYAPGGSGGRIILDTRSSGGLISFYFSSNGGASWDQVFSNSNACTSSWKFVCGVRRGSRIEIYVDGRLENSGSVTNATGTLSDTSAVTWVGNMSGGSNPIAGSISLLRVTGTAPSADQIAKIYNDEKMLFQDNAKATLYGTSDAVNALAYDEDTRLLHAGTSSGRSVFQGLRRIDNTTTAVSAAISASNGLVAEQ